MITTLPSYNDILREVYSVTEEVAEKNNIEIYGYFPKFTDIQDTSIYIVAGEHSITGEYTTKLNDGFVLNYRIHMWSRTKGYRETNNITEELIKNNLVLKNRPNLNIVNSELADMSSITEDDNVIHVIININYFVMR